MNLFLQNNDNLLPRDQVRIERVAAIPHPDRRRVTVQTDVTPFREQPNFEITILDQDGRPVTSTSVIAPMHFKMEFTLHLRHVNDPTGHYTVRVRMYYDDIRQPQDTCEVALHIPSDG